MQEMKTPTTLEPDEEIRTDDVEVVEPEKPETDALEDDALEEVDIHDVDTVLAEDDDPEPDEAAKPLAAQRLRLAERIRASRKLPKGLRERLAEVVESVEQSEEAEGQPTVPVAEAVAMIEAAIPENIQFGEGELVTPRHPRGENFFTGSGAQLSDEDAQRIASEQLAATGFGPK